MTYCWFCNNELSLQIDIDAPPPPNRSIYQCLKCEVFYYCANNKDTKLKEFTLITIKIPLKTKLKANISLFYKDKGGKRYCKVFAYDKNNNANLLLQIDSYKALSYSLSQLKKKLINLIAFI